MLTAISLFKYKQPIISQNFGMSQARLHVVVNVVQHTHAYCLLPLFVQMLPAAFYPVWTYWEIKGVPISYHFYVIWDVKELLSLK